MKHFKFWCLILVFFITLSIIILGGRDDSTRSIASVSSLETQLQELSSTNLDRTALEIKANEILGNLTSEVDAVVLSVDTIYGRGQEILNKTQTLDCSEALQNNLSEIDTLQATLDETKRDMQMLSDFIATAKLKHNKLETPIGGIPEELGLLESRLSSLNTKIEELEAHKPGTVAAIEERLIIVQADEIEALKKKNCDMEETVCRQEDQITKLTIKVEGLIADKKEVTSFITNDSSSYLSLMMMMQMNMMAMMMNNFSLHNPTVITTPFTQNRWGYSSGPMFDYNYSYPSYWNANSFGYNPMTTFPVVAEEEEKEVDPKSAEELTDEMIRKSIDKEFDQADNYISRYTAPAETFYMF